MPIYRHGDILLSPITSVPEGKPLEHAGEYILALGEFTGHAHRLRVTEPGHMKVVQGTDGVYLCLMEVGTLTHEEHSKLLVEPGTYRVGFEREYDYCQENLQAVID